MSETAQTFQISAEQAEFYEAKFVPALFEEWATNTVAAAGVEAGDRVLDVACGTGVVARLAAERAGPSGVVAGADLNPAMLAVARRISPDIAWYQADATRLPFASSAFTKVLCQSALMFFPDPVAALAEMARVTAPGGLVAIQVYSSLDAQPAYGPFVDLIAEETGPHARELMSTYWRCGDLVTLRKQFAAAGLEVRHVSTHLAHVRFDSVDALVATEVGATPLAQQISAQDTERITARSRALLKEYLTPQETLRMPIEGHIVVAAPSSE